MPPPSFGQKSPPPPGSNPPHGKKIFRHGKKNPG